MMLRTGMLLDNRESVFRRVVISNIYGVFILFHAQYILVLLLALVMILNPEMQDIIKYYT